MTIIVKVSMFAMVTILGLVGIGQDMWHDHQKYKIKMQKINNKEKNA